ncbi:hypothetical protein FIBSPDRAFT_891831 [Athelia psychrophila]|uniref:Uncharacterized protein n=1 Tax=Athelia psychrophila TaxID=1759441 RepID=A0A166J3Z0_9AGAM|nr:hypothetical protein FIBSPDRAFT_891831 [Fibularhizoctonia sp. CBS 109695]
MLGSAHGRSSNIFLIAGREQGGRGLVEGGGGGTDVGSTSGAGAGAGGLPGWSGCGGSGAGSGSCSGRSCVGAAYGPAAAAGDGRPARGARAGAVEPAAVPAVGVQAHVARPRGPGPARGAAPAPGVAAREAGVPAALAALVDDHTHLRQGQGRGVATSTGVGAAAAHAPAVRAALLDAHLLRTDQVTRPGNRRRPATREETGNRADYDAKSALVLAQGGRPSVSLLVVRGWATTVAVAVLGPVEVASTRERGEGGGRGRGRGKEGRRKMVGGDGGASSTEEQLLWAVGVASRVRAEHVASAAARARAGARVEQLRAGEERARARAAALAHGGLAAPRAEAAPLATARPARAALPAQAPRRFLQAEASPRLRQNKTQTRSAKGAPPERAPALARAWPRSWTRARRPPRAPVPPRSPPAARLPSPARAHVTPRVARTPRAKPAARVEARAAAPLRAWSWLRVGAWSTPAASPLPPVLAARAWAPPLRARPPPPAAAPRPVPPAAAPAPTHAAPVPALALSLRPTATATLKVNAAGASGASPTGVRLYGTRRAADEGSSSAGTRVVALVAASGVMIPQKLSRSAILMGDPGPEIRLAATRVQKVGVPEQMRTYHCYVPGLNKLPGVTAVTSGNFPTALKKRCRMIVSIRLVTWSAGASISCILLLI